MGNHQKTVQSVREFLLPNQARQKIDNWGGQIFIYSGPVSGKTNTRDISHSCTLYMTLLST